MAEYLFLLGKATELAMAELETVSTRWQFPAPERWHKHGEFAFVNTEDVQAEKLMELLGGTVKIYREVTRAEGERDNDWFNEARIIISQDIRRNLGDKRKVAFAVSSLSNNVRSDSLSQQIKNSLSDWGISSRFRIAKDIMSSAGVGSTFSEYLVVNHQIFVVVAVQNIDHWNDKDYGRPAVDPKSGMMPPKVARMMVNLAIGSRSPEGLRLWDPMCGSGTVLMEALEAGMNVIGSDVSEKAVHDSHLNLGWYVQRFKSQGEFVVKQADFHHVDESLLGLNQADAVAFEGFLGPPVLPSKDKLADLAKGMYKLYLGGLKQVDNFLKPGGRIAMALPHYGIPESDKYWRQLIDRLIERGYNLQVGPLFYGRPQAQVKRSIFVIEKNHVTR